MLVVESPTGIPHVDEFWARTDASDRNRNVPLREEAHYTALSPAEDPFYDPTNKQTPARSAFIPLRFASGEAFQFDWSCEYAVIGGMRQRWTRSGAVTANDEKADLSTDA